MSEVFAVVSSLGVASLLLWWIGRYAPTPRDKRLGMVGVFLLGAVTGLLGATRVLVDFQRVPPPFMLFLALLLFSAGGIAMSPWGARMSRATPLRVLTGLQSFRVLPEILLYLAWRDGVAPVQMTMHGRNIDIMTAVMAGGVAVLWPRLTRPRLWAWLVLVGGLALLANVLIVAILSTPTPLRRFMNDPAATFVTIFPYIWLPGIMVFAALVLHGMAFRALRREETAAS